MTLNIHKCNDYFIGTHILISWGVRVGVILMLSHFVLRCLPRRVSCHMIYNASFSTTSCSAGLYYHITAIT